MIVSFGAGDALAGPIVRRVEPTLASVWIALRLELFLGVGPRRPADQVAATSTPTPVAPPQVAGRTLKFGAELHVAVVMFEPQTPLAWGATYAYDLRITPDDGPEVGFDELHMLENRTYPGWFGERQSLALGYVPGNLPSFMLPAAQLNDLRLAHGSCRRDDGPGRDAMAILDDLLGDHNADPSQRIQQLWLTGDQIYANSAAPELMEDLTDVGKQLIAGNGPGGEFVTLHDETTPIDYTYPLDGYHFPAGRRLMLMNRVGGFTAEGNTAHAIGFGEFASMYLAAWHTNVWPDLLAKLSARRFAVAEYQSHQDVMEELADNLVDALKARRSPSIRMYRDISGTPHRSYYAWMLTPAAARAIDVHLARVNLVEQWDDENYHNAGTWLEFWAQGRVIPVYDGLCEPFETFRPEPQPSGDESELTFLARNLTPSWWAGRETLGISRDESPRTAPRALIGDKVRDRLHALKAFLDDVPRVRRALANVATYMIFDDHEDCEDWNITAGWVTRVRSNDLGRRVLRNGMAAYTVFQGGATIHGPTRRQERRRQPRWRMSSPRSWMRTATRTQPHRSRPRQRSICALPTSRSARRRPARRHACGGTIATRRRGSRSSPSIRAPSAATHRRPTRSSGNRSPLTPMHRSSPMRAWIGSFPRRRRQGSAPTASAS